VLIRAEKGIDREAVRAVNISAFNSPAEANLVDLLRQQAHPNISLVAEECGQVVGHIVFSPVSLSNHPDVKMMGLGPMAVVPTHQRKGIGSALVRAGLDRCRSLGFQAVVVLGHSEYYPRFGFSPAANFGICSEYDVPEDVFMVLELVPEALRNVSGKAIYQPAFGDV